MIRNNSGFSFIELMVVVVILGILAGMIVPRYMGRTDEAKVVKAKVDIAAIETSLKMYKLDNGFYPTTEQGLKALIEKPTTDPVPNNWTEGGYLEKENPHRSLGPGISLPLPGCTRGGRYSVLRCRRCRRRQRQQSRYQELGT